MVQIEPDRARGLPAWDAIVEAAVLAMIPLTRSVFCGPMAVFIMGGLIVATALTLQSLPALYAALIRDWRHTPGQGDLTAS